MFRRRICCENYSEYSLWGSALYAHDKFLVMVDSILEIPTNLSSWQGYLNSFECFGWYEIVSLSSFISFFRKNQNAKFNEWWRRGCVGIRNSVLWGKNSHNEYDMCRCVVMQQELILVFMKVWSDNKILCNSLSLTFK
jgi:hypothetical protein